MHSFKYVKVLNPFGNFFKFLYFEKSNSSIAIKYGILLGNSSKVSHLFMPNFFKYVKLLNPLEARHVYIILSICNVLSLLVKGNNFKRLELGIYKSYGYKNWSVVVLARQEKNHKVLKYCDIWFRRYALKSNEV